MRKRQSPSSAQELADGEMSHRVVIRQSLIGTLIFILFVLAPSVLLLYGALYVFSTMQNH
jgi:hypothetical protein